MVLVLQISVALWFLAEVVFQVRQYFQGGRAKTTEWGSLGLIMITAVVAGFLARLVGQALPAMHLSIDRNTVLLIVLPLLWAGVGFRLWAILTLGRYFRGVVHIQEGHKVVRAGPYRVLRHPSYTGLMVAVFGVSLLFMNLASIVVFMVCLSIGMLYRIWIEERVLLDGLGQDYANYMRETKRLIPGVW